MVICKRLLSSKWRPSFLSGELERPKISSRPTYRHSVVPTSPITITNHCYSAQACVAGVWAIPAELLAFRHISLDTNADKLGLLLHSGSTHHKPYSQLSGGGFRQAVP